MPFAICACTSDGKSVYKNIQSDYFKNLMSDILNFFETGNPSFDIAQTTEVMKIRTGVINAKKCIGKWIEL